MWIVGLVASSMAAGADQSKNITLKMLNDHIDRDVQLQREGIQRKMASLQVKGQAMDARHARDAKTVQDDNAAKWQRWAAVEKMALAKAARPGPEAGKVAAAELAAHASQQKMQITEARLATAQKEAQAAAERGFTAQQNAAQRAVQMKDIGAQNWRHKQTITEQGRQFDTGVLVGAADKVAERADKYALAAIQAYGKQAGASGGINGIEPKDLRYLPQQTGFRMRFDDGGETDIPVPKEQYDSVSRVAQTASNKAVALKDLRRAFVKADGSARMFNTDAEFLAALEAAVGPVAKELNGG